MSIYVDNLALRHAKLLGTPPEANQYIQFKIVTGLCCGGCCPNAWQFIDTFVSQWGNRVGERSRYTILIDKNESQFLYEHHESGAEIAAYVALGTSCVLLAKAIIELIHEFCKGYNVEKYKRNNEIVIYETHIVTDNKYGDRYNNAIDQEIFRSEPPLSEALVKKCAEAIAESIIAKCQTDFDVLKYIQFRHNVQFQLNKNGAKSVKIAGTFNDWCPQDMKEIGPDTWSASITTTPGIHLYKFIVDGNWITDPINPVTQVDKKGNVNSVKYIDSSA